MSSIFFFQAEDGIRDVAVTGVQTCALPICAARGGCPRQGGAAFPRRRDRHLRGCLRARPSRLVRGWTKARRRSAAPHLPDLHRARFMRAPDRGFFRPAWRARPRRGAVRSGFGGRRPTVGGNGGGAGRTPRAAWFALAGPPPPPLLRPPV